MTKSLPEPSTSEEKPRAFVIEGAEPSPVNLMYDRERRDLHDPVRISRRMYVLWVDAPEETPLRFPDAMRAARPDAAFDLEVAMHGFPYSAGDPLLIRPRRDKL